MSFLFIPDHIRRHAGFQTAVGVVHCNLDSKYEIGTFIFGDALARGIFCLIADFADGAGQTFRGQTIDMYGSSLSDMQAGEFGCGYIDFDPAVGKIRDGSNRTSGIHVFARLEIFREDYAVERTVDNQVINCGLRNSDDGFRPFYFLLRGSNFFRTRAVLQPGFLLPPLMFSPEEIEALVLGSRWVAERADAPLQEAARAALARIAAVLPEDLKDPEPGKK